MRITLLAILLLPLLQCGEPSKTASVGTAMAAASKASEWSNRRCRCLRHNRSGACLHWQCRRA